MIASMERVTVLVVPRDRFTPTFKCIETILENTTQPFDFKVVLGGTPERIKAQMLLKYDDKAELIFTENFLNPAQARNIGLKKTQTRLVAIVDNDVMVRAGWLEALVQCQLETDAALVVPIMLENGLIIHTAGNRYYVTEKDGIRYAHKELCYHGMPYLGTSNLQRSETDYGELHCQLVVAKTARDLGVYDENIQEVGECDSAKTWEKFGCKMWFEPKSVVNYELPKRIRHADDIRFFKWRWDMRTILKGYEYYKKKWDEDVTEYGIFKDFLLQINRGLGLFPRIFPSQTALSVDHLLKNLTKTFQRVISIPYSIKQRIFSKKMGYYDWPTIGKCPSTHKDNIK